MIPRTPTARARVRASASIRAPTTRIEPEKPTSTCGARSSPSGPVTMCRRPEVGPARTSVPRRPLAGDWSRIPTPWRTSRTMPGNGASRGSELSAVAIRHRPPDRNSSSPVWCVSSWPRPPDEVAVQRSPGPSGARADGPAITTVRGSRRRSASGAPRTTAWPSATNARSPGVTGKRASIGPTRIRRSGTRPIPSAISAPVVAVVPAALTWRRPATRGRPTRRARPAAGRAAPAGGGARREGRRGPRRSRPRPAP